MARIGGVSSGRRTAFGGTNGWDLRPSQSDRAASVENTRKIGVETELKVIFPQLKASDLRSLAMLLVPHVKNNFRDRFSLEISAFTNATQLLKAANIKPRTETIRNACRGGIQNRTFLEIVLTEFYLDDTRLTVRWGLRREIKNTLQGFQEKSVRVIKFHKSLVSEFRLQGRRFPDTCDYYARIRKVPSSAQI